MRYCMGDKVIALKDIEYSQIKKGEIGEIYSTHFNDLNYYLDLYYTVCFNNINLVEVSPDGIELYKEGTQ